jgi:ribosomal protein L11 methyltransferase
LYSVLISPVTSAHDDTIAAMWEFGTAGIIEEPGCIRAFFELKYQAEAAAAALDGVVNEANDTSDTQLAADDEWDPIIVGERFYIASSSCKLDTPAGRLSVTVDAQSAFGSGRHESTQLMLQALEILLKEGMVVGDIGCGSGILAIAALLLRAGTVFACDIDPNALSVAQRRPGINVFAGSADAVRTASVDLVLANISARVVDLIAPDLHRIANPQGRIVISGFVQEELPQRFRPEKILTLADWQCWICTPDPALATARETATKHLFQWW